MVLYKMFDLLKKVIILILYSCASGNIIKTIIGNFIKINPDNFLQNKPSCFLLKNEEYKVRKTIIGNFHMTYPYTFLVDRCSGSGNNKENPYFKVCLPDSVKDISVKVFDLLSGKNKLRNISFHKS